MVEYRTKQRIHYTKREQYSVLVKVTDTEVTETGICIFGKEHKEIATQVMNDLNAAERRRKRDRESKRKKRKERKEGQQT